MSISGGSLRFLLKLRSQLPSLRDRILIAGYEEADIEFVGMGNIPTAQIGKVLTDDGASAKPLWGTR